MLEFKNRASARKNPKYDQLVNLQTKVPVFYVLTQTRNSDDENFLQYFRMQSSCASTCPTWWATCTTASSTSRPSKNLQGGGIQVNELNHLLTHIIWWGYTEGLGNDACQQRFEFGDVLLLLWWRLLADNKK